MDALRKTVAPVDKLRRRPAVFGALVVFAFLYYYRPEDFIKPLSYIPMAKIVGVPLLVALVMGMASESTLKVPKAVKILLLLLVQMTICVPFALWRGGAFNTTFGFAKGVVSAMLISMVVVSLDELKRLLWIQVSAVALVTFISILINHHNPGGRLAGIGESFLSNPNDLAINIAISFPLGLAFTLRARAIKKAIWIIGLLFMVLGVVLTASRSGLLAFILCLLVSFLEFGIKGKRRSFVVVSILATLLGAGLALSSSHYRARVESIFKGDVEGSGGEGSREARKALLIKSIKVALAHPLFGVGPGCFQLVDHGWKVAHNAYTELAAEEGFPALILFLLALWAALQNIAVARKSSSYEDDPEFRLFTQALWAGLIAYMLGSIFASTEYNLYPYFLIGYTCAIVRFANQSRPNQEQGSRSRGLTGTNYERILTTEPIPTR